jgi:hypothetical protein
VSITDDAFDVALRVARACDALGITYYVGGSIASSIYGDPRSTNDVDIAIDLHESQVDAFAAQLGPDFSVDDVSLRETIARRGSWNIYFLPYALKVDLFIRKNGAFEREEFAQRQEVRLGEGEAALVVSSPENTVLRKLLWYVAGGQTSERQWRDIVGILRVSGQVLDNAHLDRWADWLDVQRLLAKARSEAGATSHGGSAS